MTFFSVTVDVVYDGKPVAINRDFDFPCEPAIGWSLNFLGLPQTAGAKLVVKEVGMVECSPDHPLSDAKPRFSCYCLIGPAVVGSCYEVDQERMKRLSELGWY